uniref:Uncharacterized protein MANES_06G174500 n=1 Tax=Rhizophora mucronata TaxID=61149 RepID=A0A2P2L5X6_RHIMU
MYYLSLVAYYIYVNSCQMIYAVSLIILSLFHIYLFCKQDARSSVRFHCKEGITSAPLDYLNASYDKVLSLS